MTYVLSDDEELGLRSILHPPDVHPRVMHRSDGQMTSGMTSDFAGTGNYKDLSQYHIDLNHPLVPSHFKLNHQ